MYEMHDGQRVACYKRLCAIILALTWPLTKPTAAQLTATSEPARVAWDFVATDPRTEHSIAELIEARVRTVRLCLYWRDPVERAIAEHITPANKNNVFDILDTHVGGG